MPPSEANCQELCTATASLNPVSVRVLGVCDYLVDGFTISDVVVTGCVITSASTLAISADTALVTVQVVVQFRFTGTQPDGTSFSETAECATEIAFLITPVQFPVRLFGEVPCAIDLSCSATAAGFDAAIGAEEFIVTVTGTVACYGCESAVVNVELCPPQG
ncbi:MAG: hypothetical protein K6U87_07435 [Firmicutes bacterium]|nr:hypothetical protein [Bacillota bacterium]